MYTNKYLYILFQNKSASKLSSGVKTVEKKETVKQSTEKPTVSKERQKKRQEKDRKIASESPRQAEKLSVQNTEITVNGKQMTVKQVLESRDPKLLVQIPDSIVSKLKRRQGDIIKKLKIQKEQEETKKETVDKVKTDEQKKWAEASAKWAEALVEKAKERINERETLLSQQLTRTKQVMNPSKIKDIPSVDSLLTGKMAQKLIAQGVEKKDLPKYESTLQADYVARNYENFAPKKNTPQYSIYVNRVNSIRHTLGMPSVPVKPTPPNITHLVNSTVLGDKREAVMNIAQDAGKSGNYESVKFDAQNDEIVFENKTNENKLVIDTGSVPPVSRMETKDGFFIETPIKEAKNLDDLKRADTYEAVQKLTEKSIDQKATFKTLDTTNPQIQKTLIALWPDAKDYIESQNNFLNEMESADKSKTTDQKLQDAENLKMKITALKNKEKTSVSQRLLQSIQTGMNEANSDLPLERTLGQQEIELTEHIKTLKELTETEKTAEILEKRRMEKENKEMEAMQKNMNEVTRAGWDRLGPEAVNGIVRELNRWKPEQAQIRLGETPLLDSQKRKLNEAVTKVLDKTRGTKNANLNIQEQYVENRQILTSIGLKGAEKEKLILASQKSETSADSLAQMIRGETESVAV